MATRRSRKKQPISKWRIVFFFLFSVLALSIVVSIFVPPEGFLQTIGSALKAYFGVIVLFIPYFIFLFGALLIGLHFAVNLLKKGFFIFIVSFFFTAFLTVIFCRINPDYIFLLGGRLIGGVVLALQGLVGGIISWLILYSLFITSIVIFTGWDIATDINSILGKLKQENKKRKTVMPFTGFDEQIQQDIPVEVNPWLPGKNQQEKPESIVIPEFETDTIQPEVIVSPVTDVMEQISDSADIQTSFQEPVIVKQEPEELPVDISKSAKQEPEKPPIDISKPIKKVTKPKDKKQKAKIVYKESKFDSSITSFSTQDEYDLPDLDFLALPKEGERQGQTPAEIEDRAKLLVSKLADFGVKCSVADSCPGPVLTRYELTPGIGVKVSKILNLSDDLALALKAKRIRILAPIPGKGAVGIEVPNTNPETVYLREILTKFNKEIIPVALGKNIEGHPYITDLTKMPHLLVAGATGSGKSVCVHAILSTILLTRSPYQVRLALIDPKMLELSAYKGIPHLWSPVVIQANKAKYLLNALVKEMEDRYSHLAGSGVRSIAEYNARFGPDQTDEYLPYIVVVIDELADLMMVSAREIEPAVARLAQMARAVGIHLVVATQRPSVDVLTGVIKANFPSRIAFNVGSIVDSRTILDMKGAEKLLGKGDMLFVPAASPEPIRVHGSFISTAETIALVKYWQEQPKLDFEYEPPDDENGNLYDPGELDFDDPLLDEVKRVIIAQQRASVSMVQRKFRVGYARAGKLIDMLERMGVVGPFVGSKPRQVLVKPQPVAEKEKESGEN